MNTMRGPDCGFRVLIFFTVVILLFHLIFDSLLSQKCDKLLGKTQQDAPHRDLNTEIRMVLERHIRRNVEEEMRGMQWNGSSLDDPLMELGGSPLRTLVVGHWRSGSSFLGELLQSHPGTFYAYEPFVFLGGHQIRNGPLVKRGNTILESLFHCQFEGLGKDFMDMYIRDNWLFGHTDRFAPCDEMIEICADEQFLSNTCRSFPVQVFKTVRYRLDALANLLLKQSLSNLKVVYLIRDPRAIMNSRLQIQWCVGEPECGNAAFLCEDLAREFHVAQELKTRFPDRFMVLSYELLVENYFNVAKKLFQFLNMEFTTKTSQFLESHTSKTIYDPFGTYRDPNGTHHWMQDLTSNNIVLKGIEDNCATAMKLWGYKRLIGDDESLSNQNSGISTKQS